MPVPVRPNPKGWNMFGKLVVALLIMSSPALAQEAESAVEPENEVATEAKSAPFKLKKVCRPQEVVGSSIPRMICSTKRIYLKPGEEAEADNKDAQEPQS